MDTVGSGKIRPDPATMLESVHTKKYIVAEPEPPGAESGAEARYEARAELGQFQRL